MAAFPILIGAEELGAPPFTTIVRVLGYPLLHKTC